jgi:hypothetical protein
VTSNLEMAECATAHCTDLREQFNQVDSDEILKIFRDFINDAAACGCSAAAFHITRAAAEYAALCVLEEPQCQARVQ